MEKIDRFCVFCGTDGNVGPIEKRETVEIEGKKVSFLAVSQKCAKCRKSFESPSQFDQNLLAAREAYEQKYASFKPKELVGLRKKYVISQKSLGLLLGFGELTMNSYEKGHVPTPPNRLLLKLADDPQVFKKIYAINKDKLSMAQRMKVEETFSFKAVESTMNVSVSYPVPFYGVPLYTSLQKPTDSSQQSEIPA